MNQLGIRSLAFVAVGGLVYALSKTLRIRQRPFAFANAREAGTWGIAATLAGWALVSVFILLAASSQGAPQGMPDKREYGAGDVVGQAIFALLAVGPALAALRWRREPWASAGVSAH